MARNLVTYQDLMTQISSYLKQKKNPENFRIPL